ncbi:MAG: IS5 family transposase [Anaerolineales bacterium]
MRGDQSNQGEIMLALTPDQLVPADHPLRRVKPIVERVLGQLSPTFNRMYARIGRPSIPPEHLLKASLLSALYSTRSERQFCARLQTDLLFKWFLDLNVSQPGFDPSTFSKNRQRLLSHDVAGEFFRAVLAEAGAQKLLSDECFTVDGTLLEAWASIKSFRPRGEDDPPRNGWGRNQGVDFRGQRRRNDTHVSLTDPEARLARKGPGKEAKLSYAGHVLMENRNGLAVDVLLTEADGYAERRAALEMLGRRGRRSRATVGADKGYDSREFVAGCRQLRVTPHLARNTNKRRSAIDGRTTRHPGYQQSQRKRKRVEEIFGWVKTVGCGRKLRYIGVARNQLWIELTLAAYNLIRIAKLQAVAPA